MELHCQAQLPLILASRMARLSHLLAILPQSPFDGPISPPVFGPGKDDGRRAANEPEVPLSIAPACSERIQPGNAPSSTRSAAEKLDGLFAGGAECSPARKDSNQ